MSGLLDSNTLALALCLLCAILPLLQQAPGSAVRRAGITLHSPLAFPKALLLRHPPCTDSRSLTRMFLSAHRNCISLLSVALKTCAPTLYSKLLLRSPLASGLGIFPRLLLPQSPEALKAQR